MNYLVAAEKYQILKKVEKERNCSFNVFGHLLLHINTQVLTNYVIII